MALKQTLLNRDEYYMFLERAVKKSFCKMSDTLTTRKKEKKYHNNKFVSEKRRKERCGEHKRHSQKTPKDSFLGFPVIKQYKKEP